jgi:hypothetical protein
LEGFIILSAKILALKFKLVAIYIDLCYKVYHINGIHIADLYLNEHSDNGTIRLYELLLVLLGSCHDPYAGPCNCRYKVSALEALEKPMLNEDEDKV